MEGLGARIVGSLQEHGEDWSSPEWPPWSPSHPRAPAAARFSASHLPTQYFCDFTADSCLVRLLPSSQERLVNRRSPSPCPVLIHTSVAGSKAGPEPGSAQPRRVRSGFLPKAAIPRIGWLSDKLPQSHPHCLGATLGRVAARGCFPRTGTWVPSPCSHSPSPAFPLSWLGILSP